MKGTLVKISLSSVVISAALAIAVPFIIDHEGESLKAYRDVVGVWTICHGETSNVRPDDVRTKDACRLLTESRSGYFMDQVHNQIRVDITPHALAAYTSFAYNIGINGFKSSQALRLLNQGKYADSCKAMMNWHSAGGKDCRVRKNNCYGLIKRRRDEVELCLSGING